MSLRFPKKFHYLTNLVLTVYAIMFSSIKSETSLLHIILFLALPSEDMESNPSLSHFFAVSYIWILLFHLNHFFSRLNKLSSFSSFLQVILPKSLSSFMLSSVLHLSIYFTLLPYLWFVTSDPFLNYCFPAGNEQFYVFPFFFCPHS